MADDHLARHGRVLYLEIPAVDAARSAAFYALVFGWTMRGDPANPAFEDAPGGLIGHFMAGRQVSSEPGVQPHIYVQGLDLALERIRAEGCEVVERPRPEGDLWVAAFKDRRAT